MRKYPQDLQDEEHGFMDTQCRHKSKPPEILGLCGRKYFLAVPINLGLGIDFRPCSEDHFLTGRP